MSGDDGLREHIAYMDDMGNPDECIEECPGCHWEGNRSCEALASGCDICDPDAVYANAPENATAVQRVRELIDKCWPDDDQLHPALRSHSYRTRFLDALDEPC